MMMLDFRFMIFKTITIMKTRIYIIAILSIVAIELSAQTYKNTYTPAARTYEASIQNQQAIQSQQIMTTGKAYNGTVYEPFSTTTPSEYNEVGGGSTTEGGNSARKAKRDLIGGPEDPLGPSPVGATPWLMMLILAVGYGIKRSGNNRVSKLK